LTTATKCNNLCDNTGEVLNPTRKLAQRQRTTNGRDIAMTDNTLKNAVTAPTAGRFRPFPARGQFVSNALIDDLYDRDGL